MARALGVVFLNGTSPTTTLSFPKIVPPDAEIAICIREGKPERIKELLVDGSASPADIVGPYGMTTLSLAISYGQHEVCRLLVAMGAHKYALIMWDMSATFWISETDTIYRTVPFQRRP